MQVGFVGLGLMGSAMARNIAKAGHAVRAWNRSSKPGTSEGGIEIVSSPEEAFQADAVLTMLSDDAAIRSVILDPGVLSRARPGAVHVVTATISLAFAEELAARHAAAGIHYLSAPVFGRPDVAEAGNLNVVVGGDPAVIARVQPLFDAIGRKTWVMGPDPRQANAAKVAGNMMIALALEAMGEAVALAGGHGVERAAFLELMTQTLFRGPVYEGYGGKIAARDFEPGFRMRLGLKDVNLAAAASETAGKALPLLDALRARMTEAVADGLGELDWSAIADQPFRSR